MAEAKKKCMVCAKEATVLKGGICDPCQDRIGREAMGEQAGISDRADKELSRHGVTPAKKERACDEGSRRVGFLGSKASADQFQPGGSRV